VNSDSAYEEITAPPNVGVELTGDVAETAAGMVMRPITIFICSFHIFWLLFKQFPQRLEKKSRPF
jgi:hypothetical protein